MVILYSNWNPKTGWCVCVCVCVCVCMRVCVCTVSAALSLYIYIYIYIYILSCPGNTVFQLSSAAPGSWNLFLSPMNYLIDILQLKQ
jgi:hypothetical protein